MDIVIKKDETILKIEQKLEKSVAYANELQVTNSDEAKRCSNELGFVKDFINKIQDRRAELVKPYNDAVKNFNASIKEALRQAEEAKAILNNKFLDYADEQERIAKEAAEKEKQRLAEIVRAEAKKAEEELLRIAESNKELEGLVDQAVQVNDAAEETVAEIIAKPVEVARTVARGEVYTSSVRKTWKAEVDNWEEFLKTVIASKRFELVKVDQANLNSYARNVGKHYDKKGLTEMTIDGMKFYQERTTQAR